jgi:hypothetical protein
MGILFWLISLLNNVSARSLVLENLGVIAAVRRGWGLARAHAGHVLLNGAVLFVIGIVFGFAAAIPALVLWVPTAQAILHGQWSAISILTGILMGLYILVVMIGLGGILTSFNSTLWTKLYKAMTGKEESPVAENQAA